MKRREFITLAGGAAAWPAMARAQQDARMRRVGILYDGTQGSPVTENRLAAFRGGLERAGWVLGSNVQFLSFYAIPADSESAGRSARQLLDSQPEVIMCNGTPLAVALKAQTSSIPVVFVSATDPVSSGLVQSLNHPGGNITGFTNLEFSIAAKWLQILKELAPDTRAVLVLTVPNNPGNLGLTQAVEAAGPTLGVRVERAMISSPEVLSRELTRFANIENGAVVTTSASIFAENSEMILQVAASRRMPTFFPSRSFVGAGGLISYGPDTYDLYRRAASYIDRLLRGAKVEDLPVQVPTKFELAINLKTARALGLTVPTPLLATADEVIE